MRVALYLRRSTDGIGQSESLETQEERLRAFAAARGDTVVAVFSDTASGVSTKRRRGFAQLIAAVQDGPAFEAVIVRDVTRWGRFENVDESAYWEFFCVIHGVPVIYAEERFDDTPRPYDALLKVIRRIYAAEFSREKARLVQAAWARLANKGFRLGPAPYGMRRVEYDKEGTAPRDVTTGGRGHFKLEPSNDKRTRLVRRIFRWFLKDNVSAGEISRRLNGQRIPSPTGRKWHRESVTAILQNAAYGGTAETRFSPSVNFPEAVVITCRKAWRPVVPASWVTTARERIALLPCRPAPTADLTWALERWKWQGPIAEAAARLTRGSAGPAGALSRQAVSELDEAALAPVDTFLHETYGVDGQAANALLKGTFEVRQLYSLPTVFHGRACWEFPFPNGATPDGYLLIGLSPPPDVRVVDMFFVQTRGMKHLRQTLRPSVKRRRSDGYPGCVTLASLRSRVDPYLYGTARAEALFRSAIGTASVINAQAVARQLGWPDYAAHSIYARLRERGEHVPLLAWKTRQTVTFRCEACGEDEPRSIRGALCTSTHLCARCRQTTRELSESTRLTCVVCGTPRLLTRSNAQKDYPNDKCRSCAGKINVIVAKSASVRVRQLKRSAYYELRREVIDRWGDRNGGAVAIGDRSGFAPSRLSLPISRGSRTRVHVRFLIQQSDTAARLIAGSGRLRTRVARSIIRELRKLVATGNKQSSVIDIDAMVAPLMFGF